MKRQLFAAAALIVAICSCNPSNESGGNDSAQRRLRHRKDVSTSDSTSNSSTSNNQYPNRQKHTFLHPYIASIDATLDTVKFFEGPYYPPQKEQRQYRVSFDARQARYIHWELNLTHKPPGQTVNFRIESEWYKSGKLFYRFTSSNSMGADWDGSYWNHGYTMGRWTQGVYRLDLSIGGQKVASEFFDVYNADCSGDISFAGTNTVESLRNQLEFYRSGGTNSQQYQDALFQLGIALHNRGGQCFLNGHLDAAFEDFSEAIQLLPNFRQAFYHRALVLVDLKRPKEALSDLNTAIQYKNYVDYYAARGRVQFHLENDIEALSDLNRAIELNPKLPELHHDRGVVLYYLGDNQNALSNLKQAASMYQSKNEQKDYQKVMGDIDILEGWKHESLKLYDRGRQFSLAEAK